MPSSRTVHNMMVCWAIMHRYVLYTSWNDPTRNKGKLLLNCSFIITSVLPPELPMNLTLAVNRLLASLHALIIFYAFFSCAVYFICSTLPGQESLADGAAKVGDDWD